MASLFRILSIFSLLGLMIFSNCGSDNDPVTPSQIGFKSTASSVLEGNKVLVEFTQNLPSGVTPTITLGGTATQGTDYTYEVKPNGLEFTAINDGIYDPDETITITLTGFSGNAEVSGNTTHTVTITETPLVIGLQTTSSTRIEGQSVIVSFTQELPAGVTPTYTLGGTATVSTDYSVVQNLNGFVFTTLTDQIYDPNETIILTLTGFTGNVVLGTNVTHEVTITDEDESQTARLVISLQWETEGGTAGDVDMDLLVWFETSPGVYTSKGTFWSTDGGFPGGTPFEESTIPGVEPSGKWAVSYVYFGGTSNNLKVKVNYRSYKGNLDGTSNRASYEATYTLVNINDDYDVFFDENDVIAQSFDKSGNNYDNITDPIFVAESGSRRKPVKFILDEEARRIINRKMQQRRGAE